MSLFFLTFCACLASTRETERRAFEKMMFSARVLVPDASSFVGTCLGHHRDEADCACIMDLFIKSVAAIKRILVAQHSVPVRSGWGARVSVASC